VLDDARPDLLALIFSRWSSKRWICASSGRSGPSGSSSVMRAIFRSGASISA
jgi:hypothetical protein